MNFQEVKIDEGENAFRFRVRDPGSFKEGSFSTIQLTEGVALTSAVLKGEDKKSPQSYRFDKSRFKTADSVRAWLVKNDVIQMADKTPDEKGKTITGIELFETGTHHEGTDQEITYSTSDLDDIIENFEKLKAGLKDGLNHQVPLVIGHEEPGEKGNINDTSGIHASGWLFALRRVGKKLVGDINQVPEKIAELIETRRFRKISVEIFNDFRGMGKVLKRIALLGGTLPEVKTLADIPIPHSEGDSESFTTYSINIGDQTMADEQKPAEKNEEHLGPEGDKLAEQIQEIMDMLKNLSERLASVEQKVDGGSEDENTDHDKDDDDDEDKNSSESEMSDEVKKELAAKDMRIKKLEDTHNHSEVEKAFDKLYRDGRIVPAQRKEARELLSNAKFSDVATFGESGKEGSAFEKMVDFLSKQPRAVEFSETAPGGKLVEKKDHSKRDPKFSAESNKEFDKVEAYMETNKVDLETAMIAVDMEG